MVERYSPMDAPRSRDVSVSVTTPSDWRAEAVAAYRRAESPDGSALCRQMAARIQDLTGQRIAPDAIVHDRHHQTASVLVDGVYMRLRGRSLCVVRACVYCRVGRFESSAVEDLADLGHALAVWNPRCAGCTEADEDWTDSF